jgi:hypothetical protein
LGSDWDWAPEPERDLDSDSESDLDWVEDSWAAWKAAWLAGLADSAADWGVEAPEWQPGLTSASVQAQDLP